MQPPLIQSRTVRPLLLILLLASVVPLSDAAETPPEQESRGLTPMLEGKIDRPLRYHPEGTDFVITNGGQFFNRPLYGGNSGFRVDAGDRPEFSFYLPGRGGNLRLAVGTVGQPNAGWLHEAPQIVARYRPGSMIYDVGHPALRGGTLRVVALTTRDVDGLILRLELLGTTNRVGITAAFGGVSGERGRRGGDIGCEVQPVSEFFQLRPQQCLSNRVSIGSDRFTVIGRPGLMSGAWSLGGGWKCADARKWNDFAGLMDSTRGTNAEPIIVASGVLAPDAPQYLGIQHLVEGYTWAPENLAPIFARAERQRKSVADRVVIDTPDPFINAAAAALNVAADAVWDERQSSFMHGAVAWRVRLLGWRGAYSGDELGWHDRTARHFSGYAAQQNTNLVPTEIPAPESTANLSRNENALHSNGDMTRTHYDMNLIAVDAFFRHLLWTGDLEYARRMWPVIERHLAWERRLFRREFGSEKLPLYEAYCCIWASDDLAYNGGGAAHSSAFNLYHNQLAARVAGLIGKDPAPYEREAALIARGMRTNLWLADRGWFAEWKDLLGLQLAHPNNAVWTYYHTVDSEVPTPFEAWQMSRFVDSMIPRLPVRGANVPDGNYNIATSSWMPYTWSLNNVVLGESAQTALAYWQAGRPDAAMPLFKGTLLDSMYCGVCPGNVGMCTYFDAYRRESQRDFADGVGSLSRALIEGLFGVKPDVLAGELKLRPGFPATWDHASIQHPDFSFDFRRTGMRDTYTVKTKFSQPIATTLEISAIRDQVQAVRINGDPGRWQVVNDAIGVPRIRISTPAAAIQEIAIDWKGEPLAKVQAAAVIARGSELEANCGADVLEVIDPQGALGSVRTEKKIVRGSAIGLPGARTVFARVKQGAMEWWQPIEFEIRPAFEIVGSETQDDTHLRFRIRNNNANAIDREVSINVGGKASNERLRKGALEVEFSLSAPGLVPGSNPVVLDTGDAGTFSNNVVNWNLKSNPSVRFETVAMENAFNDRVGQIFRNEYLSPRSPYCSLAVPKQGIGSWTHPTDAFNVDDSGLRAASAAHGGKFVALGIPFATPATQEDRNILFTSQWTNYPAEASVPLSGKASHVYLLMTGSSNPMQSRIDNGEVEIAYADGSSARLALENPVNWWPIDQDYFIDDFAFRRPEPIPPRVDLKTGLVRVLNPKDFKGKGRAVPGGAATVLDLPLDSTKELKSITVRTIANEVVIGLMAATLVR